MIAEGCTEVWSTDEPYTVKVFRPFLNERLYSGLRAEFPEAEELPWMPGVGYKRSVSDGKRGGFAETVASKSAWKKFHKKVTEDLWLMWFAEQHFPILRNKRVRQKIELSLLPSDGGCMYPYPDTDKKLVTAVIYMADDDWDPSWGGGFAVVKPRNEPSADPIDGYQRLSFDAVDLVHEINFVSNTAVFMEQSAKSFHTVYPLRAPDGRHRKSVTVNFMGRREADRK